MNAYEHNPTMWTWARMVGRDVLSALVGVVICSLVTLRMDIWNFIRPQPFQWTIGGAAEVTVVALSVTLWVLVIFRRKRPELTPYSTGITRTDQICLITLGVKNIGEDTAYDTQATAIIYGCSGKYTPFEVSASTANPFPPNVSEQIRFRFAIEPTEPIFIAISFAYRSRPNGKLKEQRPLFYYKWSGVGSALVHASKEERDQIENARVGQRRPRPPGAFLY
jgi:hypothetical protein